MKQCKATVLHQQHAELPGRAPSREKERCLPDSAVSMLGLALLCFALLPPSHSWLSVQAVRTVTAPAGADLNFTWEVKCWLWQCESFHHCAVAQPLLFPLSHDSISQTKPYPRSLSFGSWHHLSPAWLVSSPTLLSVGYLKFLLRALCHFSEVALALMGCPFSAGRCPPLSYKHSSQGSDSWLFSSCCRDWWMHPICCGPPIPVMCKVWADVGFENILPVFDWLSFIYQSLLEKSGQVFKCWSLFKAFWIS